MKSTFLVITSIAAQEHPILNHFAKESPKRKIHLIVIGDKKSPNEFNIQDCDFYSINKQEKLPFGLAAALPTGHYARKNLGYLVAMSGGAELIIETDDDNEPLEGFWGTRKEKVKANLIAKGGWVNAYKYFTEKHIWPRGFALEHVNSKSPKRGELKEFECPIQQGLADENPDVDALYRLTMKLPIKFEKAIPIALGAGSFCPFNSQNTTWFKKAFSLMYLPSYCSFRMTDIWRSFIAQRIAWSCGWSILFHRSTVKQIRNNHDLMADFKDELIGYTGNLTIYNFLKDFDLAEGEENIPKNMKRCYEKLIELGFVDRKEFALLDLWLKDVASIAKNN